MIVEVDVCAAEALVPLPVIDGNERSEGVRLAKRITPISGVRGSDAGYQQQAAEREVRRGGVGRVVDGDVDVAAPLGDTKQCAAVGEDAAAVGLPLIFELIRAVPIRRAVNRRVRPVQIDATGHAPNRSHVHGAIRRDPNARLQAADDERDPSVGAADGRQIRKRKLLISTESADRIRTKRGRREDEERDEKRCRECENERPMVKQRHCLPPCSSLLAGRARQHFAYSSAGGDIKIR